MKKIVLFQLVVLSFILLAGCGQSGGISKEQAEKIGISWKLVSNFVEPAGSFEAKFTIRNGSDFTMDGSNWALFFNMSPRPIQTNKMPQPATVEHINGDWYKMVPAKDFKLNSGDSIVVNYKGTDAVIKETDAPLGLYFVFYDKEGKEKDIVQVADYSIEPFTTKEQILRGKNDRRQIPTAETRYKDNLAFTKIGAEQLLKIIPSPVKINAGSGTFALSSKSQIFYQEGLENEARFMAAKLKTLSGTDFTIKNGLPANGTADSAAIVLKTDKITVNGIAKEAYHLGIDQKGISISGSDAAGVFYGIQSLLQLVPTANYQKADNTINLGYIQVEDAPRFHFRSLHLDVARNFQTKESVKRMLDLLAAYKVNHLLFYITEDEGWRVEIDGLPELTEIGSQRSHTAGMNVSALHPSYGSGPVANDEGKYGSGHYTKADFIEILKYANERHIKVIPELNFPGHALAAIKSMEARYDRLMKEGKEKEANEYRLIDPEDKSVYISAQGYKNNVVSVARESTYHFYEKVVDEIAKLYKQAGLTMDTFHTGGDEVAEGVWTKSPMAAKLMKENPNIKDAKNLQSYFFGKLLPRLEKRNLKVHGWEEVALTKTPEGIYLPNPEFAKRPVVPYIWNNIFDVDLGNRLANAGYQVVFCNVTNFYFDMSYNNDPKEPGLYWGGFVDTRDNWTFAPFNMFRTTEENALGKPLKEEFVGKQLLKPEARKNVLGIEAQLWSETIKGRDMMEYSVLPKLLGFSESAWSPERQWENVAEAAARGKMIAEGWNIFANSIAQKHLPRLKYVNGGYNYRLPMPGAVVENGMLKANVELPGLAIRYTTDGSEPTAASPAYAAPVKVSGTVKLKSFDLAGRSSRTSVVTAN
ncbi:family 20 glycosylhydrolase [Dyadobacter sediminis]|uniref:beta-N-acetylhexosaminidase n=1 Tax=Dyadobacter sediminis TaxID=1493691 RepID=A0A5R9K8N4_9BACT|nr:family 20 glycosylhydrolase [Dyadobacter sediminis]TLU90411.1 beta-N-acetylhexosaminidase [Dyadobacter sediminis]GGC07541.1 beta-N-acetylhexosaminidase [Dyadobacter sediminis]